MDLILEILSIPLVQSILKIAFIILLFAMPLGTVLTLMERKWSAMIQDRVGPNRANVGNYTGNGLLHLAADGLKSIFKEDTIPQGANGFLYLIAPFFGLIAGVATFAIIPIAGPIGDFTFQVTDIEPGLLFIFAITSLSVYGAVLAGTSSNSKFALLGGTRASAQMISYEVFMGLALMGIFMVYGSTRVSDIVNGQNEYWFGNLIPMWGVFTQPLGFFLFFTALIAETKRAPFDAPEGESDCCRLFSRILRNALECIHACRIRRSCRSRRFNDHSLFWRLPCSLASSLGKCPSMAGNAFTNRQIQYRNHLLLLAPNPTTMDTAKISI